jgi:hypothetical protein
MKIVKRSSKRECLVIKLWLDGKTAYLNYVEGRKAYLREVKDAEDSFFSTSSSDAAKKLSAATILVAKNYVDRDKFDKSMKKLGFTSSEIARQERAYRANVGKKMLETSNSLYGQQSDRTDNLPLSNIGGALMVGMADSSGNLYGASPVGSDDD